MTSLPRVLKTEADHEAAIEEIEDLWESATGTPEADRLELLALLVSSYEDAHHAIDLPSPVAAIRFRMEQLGMSKADLGRVLGSRSRATEVLNGTRPLSLAMIRRLNRELAIPAEVLIREAGPQSTSSEHAAHS